MQRDGMTLVIGNVVEQRVGYDYDGTAVAAHTCVHAGVFLVGHWQRAPHRERQAWWDWLGVSTEAKC